LSRRLCISSAWVGPGQFLIRPHVAYSLPTLFVEVLDLRDQLGSPIRQFLRPPLPRARITTLFQQADIQAPGVLKEIYSISDGFEPAAEVRFIGDKALIPLEAAFTAYFRWKPILLEFGHPPLFPIAEDEFGGAYGVLLSGAYDADPPVLSLPLQCGTDQFFDSVTLLFATLAAWLRAGLKSAYDSVEGNPGDLELYRSVGRDLNPKSRYERGI